jgi:adenine-specific DNA-methyltransferase
MRRRLLIARRLLKPDGVLIVTIDEHEVHHLGMLLEDVMREYLQQMITIVINPKGTGKLNFARVEEHAIYCIPDIDVSVIAGEPTAAGQLAAMGSQDGDEEDDADDSGVEPDDAATARPPFPAAEADLWELRHARRRGGESSYPPALALLLSPLDGP